jgi:hypothetical protein
LLEPKKGDEVYALGHPNGLPLKYSFGGEVISAADSIFVATLDTFSGNSGRLSN